MVEFALVAPFLVILLAGGSQVGAISYAQISVDTAAREGARAGVEAPNNTLAWTTPASVPVTRTCTVGDYTSNPICVAVLNASGFLTPSSFTTSAPTSYPGSCAAGQACTTFTVKAEGNLTSSTGSSKARLAASSGSGCNAGSQETVNGTVSNLVSGNTATVIDTTGESTTTDASGAFTMCVTANSSTTSQSLTARSGTDCNESSGSVGPFPVVAGGQTPEAIALAPSYAVVNGFVNLTAAPGGSTAAVSDDTGDSVSNVTGSFSLCVAASDARTQQTITAIVGGVECGGYSGSVGPIDVISGHTYSPSTIVVSAEPTCTTTTTSSSSSSSSSSTTASSGCVANPDWSKYYVTVTVTYPEPIFVPFIAGLLQSQPGVRTVSAAVTYSVEPCTLTQGS